MPYEMVNMATVLSDRVGMKTQGERKEKLIERVWRMMVISHRRHTRTGQGWCGNGGVMWNMESGKAFN